MRNVSLFFCPEKLRQGCKLSVQNDVLCIILIEDKCFTGQAGRMAPVSYGDSGGK